MNTKTKLTYTLLAGLATYATVVTIEAHDLERHYQTERQMNDQLLDEQLELSDEKESLRKDLIVAQDQLSEHKQLAKDTDAELTELSTRYQELEEHNAKLASDNKNLKERVDGLLLELETKFEEQRQEAPPEVSKASEPTVVAQEAMTFQATAYVATGNPTASGVIPTVGRTIATDPAVIPTGSTVEITVPSHPQYNGVYVAEDTGGAITGNIIDLFVAGHAEAVAFGRQPIHVKIMSEPDKEV